MLDANARHFHIIKDGKILKSLPIQGLQAEEASLFSYIRAMQDEARSIALSADKMAAGGRERLRPLLQRIN